jgi:hypothetical protein
LRAGPENDLLPSRKLKPLAPPELDRPELVLWMAGFSWGVGSMVADALGPQGIPSQFIELLNYVASKPDYWRDLVTFLEQTGSMLAGLLRDEPGSASEAYLESLLVGRESLGCRLRTSLQANLGSYLVFANVRHKL